MAKSQIPKKVIVVTGSSGGHIFPALSFLESLKLADKNIEAVLVLPRRSLIKVNLPGSISVKYSSVTTVTSRFSRSNLKAVYNFIKGLAESLILTASFKPDITVGFGSLNSVPFILWAWLFRQKTIIHEQNVIPGKANKLLSKFADKIAISFAETTNYLTACPQNLTFTGNPLRKSLCIIEKKQALDFFGLDSGKFTIIISGGSQGSSRINEGFLGALRNIADKTKLQVIHLTGEKDFGGLEVAYQAIDIRVKLFSFLEKMQYAYSAADLAITRAGAMTISELIYFNLPAILVPYPFAEEHQLANARVLESGGCAIVINDRDFNSAQINNYIVDFLIQPAKIENMRSGFIQMRKSDANQALVKEVLTLTGI